MKRTRPRTEDFTVGWISALPVEYAAAKAMLDEEYEGDGHMVQYTLGRIHDHNVVMACLPAGQIGTNAAATAAAEMRFTFPALRFGLLVGIGGGVPSKDADIRLGDVVISQPQGGYGGVVQYDLGKTLPGGKHLPTGFMNAPSRELLTAVSILRSKQTAGRSNLSQYLSELCQLTEFSRYNNGPDNLFDPLYDHVGKTCDECDQAMIIPRAPRISDEPRAHFGTIASGNQVIKDGTTRDRLSAEFGGVLCFEMEAAGLMNQIDCLVIRGICDYSDSHKNKKWQPFAAAAAAACAKEILSSVPSGPRGSDPNRLQPKSVEERSSYMDSLRFEQMQSRQETIKNAHVRTCQWLLDRSEYKDWLDFDKFYDHKGFLWIKGKPATGKSTIMKFAYTQTVKKMRDKIIISFFFNARGEEMEKSVLGMYRSLLWQLLHKLPELQVVFDALNLVQPMTIESHKWGLENTQSLLKDAIERLGQRPLMCFVDALDECEEDQVRDMISFFEQLGEVARQSGCHFNVCFSSRHYPHISISAGIELVLEDQDDHAQDIQKYINTQLRIKGAQLADQIKEEVLKRSSGIFLWVVLVVQMLNKLIDRGQIHKIRQELLKIPNGLHELLEDILMRGERNMAEMVLCLQWILYAKRPLNCEELYFAILSGIEPDSFTELNPEITKALMKRFILDSSKGLAEETKSKKPTIQFIHESVRDFLLKENILDKIGIHSSSNFPALSHDSLKKCCLAYMRLGVSLDLMEPLPKASSDEARDLRQRTTGRLPFLQYAVQHVLHHSNASQKYGLSQDAFLQTFPLDLWITLNNLFERFEIRRYTRHASQLYIFAEKDLASLIHVVLQHNSDINIEGERYRHPLVAAIVHRNEDAIKALLEPDPSLNTETAISVNNTIFPTATEYEDAINHMLTLGEKAATRGFSIQSYAIQHRISAILKVLFVARAYANSRTELVNARLVLETERGNAEMVQMLVQNGADIETRNRFHQTLLSWAAKIGNIYIVQMLLQNGANIESRDRLQRTPLSLAMSEGHTEMVQFLLQNGANIESRDRFQRTPLYLAVLEGHTEMVQLLLQNGAHTESEDNHAQNTPLSLASQKGYTDIVKILLQNGADVESRVSLLEDTPLSLAVQYGHTDVVQVLLENGAYTEFRDVRSHETPLSLAAREGRTDIVRILLENGADTESGDSLLQETPLSLAVQNGHTDVVQVLLKYGARIETSDSLHKKTPLSLAVQNGHTEIVDILLKNGAGLEPIDSLYEMIPPFWQHEMDIQT
ncbi:hypothetical protein DTO271G3_3076 [Paecilomyces variotii]|nr:hypothetical protein DTO271G3_3076 [Paecilomyces variotii]